MNQVPGIFLFSLTVTIVIMTVIYRSREKNKKKEIRNKFRKFTENTRLSKKELRTVPRISIPETVEIVLTLTDNEYFGLKAYAVDMSLSGFAVKPDFPLKKLPMDTYLKNVIVVTPINRFVIDMIRTVRLEHQVDKRLLAFHIEQIDGDQFEILKNFIAYLDTFLKKNEDDETS
ncbi:MAG: hypothetical protein MUF15_00115 [Acidobacteria bacterium]|nr:hypothetical protein [Acidobacteriota bacterium]